jgi:hypothetical protein
MSGAVMGMVYLNVFLRHGLATALMKAFERAWILYLITIFLTLTSAALASFLDVWWAPSLGAGEIPQYVFDVVTMHRTIYLADILLMYTFFLLGAGPVILLLSQGKTAIVLALSWAIWIAFQISPESSGVTWEIQENTVFNIAAWQVLFVNGIVIGWHREQIEAWVRRLSPHTVAAAVLAAGAIVLLLYVAQLTQLDALKESGFIFDLAFDKPQVPMGRLLVFGVLAIFSFALTTIFWTPISRFTGWLLLPLGENALTAYSVHIYLVAITTKVSTSIIEGRGPDDLVSTLIQIGGVMFVWLFIRFEPPMKEHLLEGFVLPAWRHFRQSGDAEIAP